MEITNTKAQFPLSLVSYSTFNQPTNNTVVKLDVNQLVVIR